MRPRKPFEKLAKILSDEGEILAHILPPESKPRRKKLNRNFVFIWQETSAMLNEILNDKEITLTDWRVLFYIVKRIEYQNKFFGTQKEIAENLGLHIKTVRESIRKLTKKGFLISRKHLEVNHCLAYRGSADSLDQKAVECYREVMDSTFDETD